MRFDEMPAEPAAVDPAITAADLPGRSLQRWHPGTNVKVVRARRQILEQAPNGAFRTPFALPWCTSGMTTSTAQRHRGISAPALAAMVVVTLIGSAYLWFNLWLVLTPGIGSTFDAVDIAIAVFIVATSIFEAAPAVILLCMVIWADRRGGAALAAVGVCSVIRAVVIVWWLIGLAIDWSSTAPLGFALLVVVDWLMVGSTCFVTWAADGLTHLPDL